MKTDQISSSLLHKPILTIFTYAPTGLGHLRVMDALYHGMPSGLSTPLLLGANDTRLTFIHRIMSTHVVTRHIMEWLQQGAPEEIFSILYRVLLRSQVEPLYKQLLVLINQQIERPQTLLIIATHFGLAHQLSVLKKEIEAKTQIRVVLVLQVTDDSPQHLWYVSNADVIFVPSEKTKRQLIAYGKSKHFPMVNFNVVAYPLSPVFSQDISHAQQKERIKQVVSQGTMSIHIAIPISGAAVGTKFFTDVMRMLHKKSHRFIFHIAAQDVPYTQFFIQKMKNHPYVNITVSHSDRAVIDAYEKLYQENSIVMEITKPSEQAFKALLNCEKRGASLLLFSEPIGRQEYDNLDFLRRHFLIPSLEHEALLFEKAEKDANLVDDQGQDLLLQAGRWRGIVLPKEPRKTAQFIWWCLDKGIFSNMLVCKKEPTEDDPHKHEIDANGVTIFWKEVISLLDK